MEVFIKKGPFYSVELGKWVKNMKEFDEELDKLRYMSRMSKHLARENGYNKTPRDEWVEAREEKEKESQKQADRDWSEDQEWQERARKSGA